MLLMENLGQARLIGDLKMSEHVHQVVDNQTLPTPTQSISQ